MPRTTFRAKAPCLALCAVSLLSFGLACAQNRPTRISYAGADGRSRPLLLINGGGESAAGYVSQASGPAEYAFPESPGSGKECRLELDYKSSGIESAALELMYGTGGKDGASAEVTDTYPLPISALNLVFSMPAPAGAVFKRARFSGVSGTGRLEIHGFSLKAGDWFSGYERNGDSLRLSPGLTVRKAGPGESLLELPVPGPGAYSAVIALSDPVKAASAPVLSGPGLGNGVRILANSGKPPAPVGVPFVAREKGVLSLRMARMEGLRSLSLNRSESGPLEADPDRIMAWGKSDLRFGGYDLFSWDAFPDVLILLCADYGVQDRMLKRLAFFVEKAGFRGRLAADAEIAPLHGWNAHDYRASDLARFFGQAQAESFPLGAEERELRGILESAGVIRKSSSGWEPGAGALLSVSLETQKALRERFIVHEGVHGIYFTQEDFRASVERIWSGVDQGLRGYILEFFDYKELDVTDPDLMANEFGAYFLQTPVDETPKYFCGTVADFLEQDKRGGGRYRSFALSRYGDFRGLAAALDAELFRLYGLDAGRVWRTESR